MIEEEFARPKSELLAKHKIKDIKQSLVEIEADLKGRLYEVHKRDPKSNGDNLHLGNGMGIGPTEGLSNEQVG